MSVKPVELSELLKGFADYLTVADILAAKTLAKISATILKKRIDMGMTQTQFADFMEVSQAMISKWESDDYNFSIETLAKICDKLDLDLDIEMKSNVDCYKEKFINNNCRTAPFYGRAWKQSNQVITPRTSREAVA